MARNPYAGMGGGSDPYTNGNGLRAPQPGGEDYDPYGDTYGGAPRNPSSQDRRQRPARSGGYGGFSEEDPPSSAPGGRYGDDRAPMRSPLRNGGNARRYGYDDDNPMSPPTSGRSGGYGRERERPTNGNQYGNGYDGERDAGRSRGNETASRGGGTEQMEEILEYIQEEWGFMTEDNCVPVQIALQLMDSSSIGRAHQSDGFRKTHKQLQKSLKTIVNEYHQGFNSSIGTFHKIQSSIQSSQQRVRSLRDSLEASKINLSTMKPELRSLAATSQNYDEMLRALNEIEQLRLVTDKLEARISEKRFLTAVDVLQDALRMIRKPEMDNIGALSDLRTYLSNQETSLTDILIEELHSHLYLKSPYCQDRWKAHSRELSNGASSEGKDTSVPAIQPLYMFLDDLNVSEPMVEDPARNPEADSFYYVHLLVESLSKLGRLDIAVNSIEQRLPVELFRVVDKTNNEVDQRHPSALRGNTRDARGKANLNFDDSDAKAAVMRDLLWTLYAKFEAIAESHRVFHEVVVGIAKRERVKGFDGLVGSFKELWKLYQNEIRSLLHDYLATDDDMYRSEQAAKASEMVYQRGQRNRTKKLFSLTETDSNSTEMSTELDELESILKVSVPGLVSESRRPEASTANENNQATDGAAGHKLLIEPSVFNMGLLLPPSLGFLQRLRDIVPLESDIKMSTLTSFLDDFLINVFLPQLDDTITELSRQIMVSGEAFREDSQWTHVARKPVFKGATSFFSLISVFCRMLDTLPHDQAFSQLIITQMAAYYDYCCNWYKALVSRTDGGSPSNGSNLKASAAFAAGPGEIHETMQKLWTQEEEDPALLDKEAGLLILHTNENPLSVGDVIIDRKTISSLSLLYTSMRWLGSKINQLRHITRSDTDSSSRKTGRVSYNQSGRWSLLASPSKVMDGAVPVYLPMTQETVVAFDSMVASYQDFAATVLLTIHMEIRCQIIVSLTHVLSPTVTPYVLEQVVNEPDERILSLNADLVSYDEHVNQYLRDREATFIRTGLGLLINNLLVSNAGTVGAMNAYGCGRMQLNILVLQQNLKNIEQNVSLTHAAKYFELFTAGTEAVIAHAKATKKNPEEKYTYEELKTLLELCYSEQMASPERGTSQLAKRKLDEDQLQLSEYMWQT